ncbi:MAG: hypothetical protein LBV00_05915 [Propionibacteriaceae bacterium]|jgi:hypothetical protein|nr:hypothetical protein [Propionibacteriaceae bacterium]
MMTSPQSSDPVPRRSYPGPQTNAAATPRRAWEAPDEPPILAGYTYQPGHSEPVGPSPQAAEPIQVDQSPATSISDYRPRRRLGWILLIAVLVVVAIIGGILINNLPVSNPSATQSRPLSYTTQTRTGGVSFDDGKGVVGYWKITHTAWTATGVRLTLDITVDTGTLYYQFYAYGNTDRQQILPTSTRPTDLEDGFIGSGETVTGTLTFETTRQPMTLVMSSANVVQLSALQIDD